MLALAVAVVIEHHRRRRCPTERPVIADVDPTSSRIGLAFGQNRHGGVVAMQAFGRHDMRFDPPQNWIEGRAARSHGVGYGREADRNAFQGIALGLSVQGLMLAELLKQDHRQQVGAGPSPRDHVEGRRCLADLLAIPAGELLPHGFDHLPLARDRFQGPGDILAQLAQPIAATAVTCRRRIDDHAIARQVIGEGIPLGALAGEPRHKRRLGHGQLRSQLILRGTRFQFLELQRAPPPVRRPRRAILARSIVNAAFSASMSSGRSARAAAMTMSES